MKNTNLQLLLFASVNSTAKENRFVWKTPEGFKVETLKPVGEKPDPNKEAYKSIVKKNREKLECLGNEVKNQQASFFKSKDATRLSCLNTGKKKSEKELEKMIKELNKLIIQKADESKISQKLKAIRLKEIDIYCQNLTLGRKPEEFLKDILFDEGVEFPDKIINRLAKSTVVIFQIKEGEGSKGTGIAISKEWILTNKHVVEKVGATTIIRTLDNKNIEVAEIVPISDGYIEFSEVKKFEKTDLALIRVKNVLPDYVPIARQNLQNNGKAVSIGFGMDKYDSPYLDEHDAKKAWDLKDTVTAQSGKCLEDNYFISDRYGILHKSGQLLRMSSDPGDSGGPLLDENGNLVGVVKMAVGSKEEIAFGTANKTVVERRDRIVEAIENNTDVKVHYGDSLPPEKKMTLLTLRWKDIEKDFAEKGIKFSINRGEIKDYSDTMEKLKILATRIQPFSQQHRIIVTFATSLSWKNDAIDEIFLDYKDEPKMWENFLKNIGAMKTIRRQFLEKGVNLDFPQWGKIFEYPNTMNKLIELLKHDRSFFSGINLALLETSDMPSSPYVQRSHIICLDFSQGIQEWEKAFEDPNIKEGSAKEMFKNYLKQKTIIKIFLLKLKRMIEDQNLSEKMKNKVKNQSVPMLKGVQNKILKLKKIFPGDTDLDFLLIEQKRLLEKLQLN